MDTSWHLWIGTDQGGVDVYKGITGLKEKRPYYRHQSRLSVSSGIFKNAVTIHYILPEQGTHSVRLEIFDISGRLVNVLEAGRQRSGSYSVKWEGKNREGEKLPEGVYFIRLNADNTTETKAIYLVR